MRLHHFPALVLLALTAAACGSDSKGVTDPGGSPTNATYSATVSGGVNRSLTGQAVYAADNADPEVGFALALADGTTENAILFWRRTPSALAVGQHTIANYYAAASDDEIPDNQLVSVVLLQQTGNVPLFCASTGGQVTITSSAGGRLAGRFTMAATCANIMTGAETDVSLSGTFNAATGNVTLPD